jgi:hypothetical protein
MNLDFIISNDKKFDLSPVVFKKINVKNNYIYFNKSKYKEIKFKNNLFYIFGNINGYYDERLNLKIINNKKLLELINNNKTDYLDGKFLIIKIIKDKEIKIFTDYFKRYEIFYYKKNEILISSSLEPFIKKKTIPKKIDYNSISHSLSIYGNRPFKEDTVYLNIHRISLNQKLIIKTSKLLIENKTTSPLNINNNFSKKDIDNYAKAFFDTLKIKSHKAQNIIYLSSGWDSTSILAGLIKLGKRKSIRCVIGKMTYSKNLLANKFEIDRAKKICDYFKVKLHIIGFDYYKLNKTNDPKLFEFLLHNQLASITSINHWYLAKYVKAKFGSNCSVFCGEISDGAHNLGFSQYVSIHHPASYDFREYSDKMSSYLFGPTFLKYIYLKKDLRTDPVFNIYENLNKNLDFEKIPNDKKKINALFLSAFFLRPSRIPFVKNNSLNFLTTIGRKKYENDILNKKIFKNSIKNLRPENVYSTILKLYNVFHWQGSTVISFEKTCGYFGLTGHLPFLDRKIINILSIMPEKFGRGLDFENTKMPLKSMLKNKLDYPFHLQSGPHSYLYDVDRNFNHNVELMYNSAFKKIFLKKIKERKFIKSLDKKYFNINYINNISSKYLKRKKVNGQEINDLFALILHEVIYSNLEK